MSVKLGVHSSLSNTEVENPLAAALKKRIDLFTLVDATGEEEVTLGWAPNMSALDVAGYKSRFPFRQLILLTIRDRDAFAKALVAEVVLIREKTVKELLAALETISNMCS